MHPSCDKEIDGQKTQNGSGLDFTPPYLLIIRTGFPTMHILLKFLFRDWGRPARRSFFFSSDTPIAEVIKEFKSSQGEKYQKH
jgi:hypothetical protein